MATPDLARARARHARYSHAPVPTIAHDEARAWSNLLNAARAWRTVEALRLTCTACGFVTTDTGERSCDQAHDELCCQQPDAGLCRALAVDLCVTHDVWPGETVPSAVFVVAL
jgi:hypothetical protein